jgi:glutamate--cysteine ligase
MPTTDRGRALSLDEAREHAGLLAFPDPGPAPKLGGIGLEPEFFPVRRGRDGRPAGRLLLTDPVGGGVYQIVDELMAADERFTSRRTLPFGALEYLIDSGGRLTFEPGAQVEFSTAVYESVTQAMVDIDDVVARLRSAFTEHSVELAAIGIDVWNDVETVPQQLRAGRYTAQAAYYRQRGHWGAIMMRHTASLQINLDLGPDEVWQQRWLAANLASPLLTATFACSPGLGAVCSRARAWQELDPTRSGFPRLLIDGSGDDPRLEWGQAAIEADVMMFRTDSVHYEPGCPGCSFEKWITDGHPRWGWPTVEDLEYHVTTLFFEVRPRGFLELRAGEALPGPMRSVPVALMTALLYDDQAREEAIDLLAPLRPNLPDFWRRAAIDGVRDPVLRELAFGLWSLALRAAGRLPESFIGRREVEAAESFLADFTAHGRMPTDELLALLAKDETAALVWASS